MEKTITLLFALFIVMIKGNTQLYDWAKSMGGTDESGGISIAVDDSGNVYTTGSFWGIIDFDPSDETSNLTSMGLADIFISKLDPAGNFLWAKSMGGVGLDVGLSIAIDGSGNIYTTGYFNDEVDFDPGVETSNLTSAGAFDIFISKLDPDGNLLSASRIGGIYSDYGTSIAIDDAGNCYTSGAFKETVDFDLGDGTSYLTSSGGIDVFILKQDASGNLIYAKSLGGVGEDICNSNTVDESGNVYITGYYEETADFDPGEGTNNLTSAGGFDIFISKLDALGNFLWAKSLGDTGWDNGLYNAVDNSGNLYITGYFNGTVDFDSGVETNNLTTDGSRDIFVLKLDASGDFAWAKSIGGISDDFGYSIVLDDAGNVYFTGSFYGHVDFDPGVGNSYLTAEGSWDIYIAKLDASGNFGWAKSIGAMSYDQGSSIAVDGVGNVFTTGYFYGEVDFDPGEEVNYLTSLDFRNIFILKLASANATILENNFGNTLTVYPNPTKGAVTIDLGEFQKEVTVIISNQLGQVVLNKSYSSTNVLQFNIEGEVGVYFIEVNSGDKKAIIKVVKE